MMLRVVLSVLALGLAPAGAFQAPRPLTTGWRAPMELKSSNFLAPTEAADTFSLATPRTGQPALLMSSISASPALSSMTTNANNWNSMYNGHNSYTGRGAGPYNYAHGSRGHNSRRMRGQMTMYNNGGYQPSFGYNNNGYGMYNNGMGYNGDSGAGYGMNNRRRMRGYNNYNGYNNNMYGPYSSGYNNNGMRYNDRYDNRRMRRNGMYNGEYSMPSFGYNNPYNGYNMYNGPYSQGYGYDMYNGDTGAGYGMGDRRRMRGYRNNYNGYTNGPMTGPGYNSYNGYNRYNGDRGNGRRRLGGYNGYGYNYNTGYNGYMGGDGYNSYNAYNGGTYDD